MKRKSAFTLIELLVVVSIISLLSSIVLASLNSARDKARQGSARSFAAQADRVAGELAIAYWDFDECAGTSVADRSNNGYTGTLSNASMWSAAVPFGSGCAALFDGVDDFVDTSYTARDQSAWTMSAWVYDTKANSGYRAIVQTNVASDDALYIYPNNSLGFWPCGSTASNSFPSNQWVHVAATYDSSIGFKYYLNGVQVGTGGVCADAMDWDFLRIGAHSAGDGERWQGRMDSVHIFGKTLVASDIEEIYAQEKPRFEKLANGY